MIILHSESIYCSCIYPSALHSRCSYRNLQHSFNSQYYIQATEWSWQMLHEFIDSLTSCWLSVVCHAPTSHEEMTCYFDQQCRVAGKHEGDSDGLTAIWVKWSQLGLQVVMRHAFFDPKRHSRVVCSQNGFKTWAPLLNEQGSMAKSATIFMQ